VCKVRHLYTLPTFKRQEVYKPLRSNARFGYGGHMSAAPAVSMDYAYARLMMVEAQLRANKLIDTRLIDAFKAVPREQFVAPAQKPLAYIDNDIPVGFAKNRDEDRYLMEPMILARLIQEAQITQASNVLDIGVATGYSSAILAHLTHSVTAIEENTDLATRARKILKIEAPKVTFQTSKLTTGYKKNGPYDVILVQGAVEDVPNIILSQLKKGGRLLAVEDTYDPATPEASTGKAVCYLNTKGHISKTPLFDAHIRKLPGFTKPRGFEF